MNTRLRRVNGAPGQKRECMLVDMASGESESPYPATAVRTNNLIVIDPNVSRFPAYV